MNYQDEENDFFKLAEEESAERERKELKKQERREKKEKRKAEKKAAREAGKAAAKAKKHRNSEEESEDGSDRTPDESSAGEIKEEIREEEKEQTEAEQTETEQAETEQAEIEQEKTKRSEAEQSETEQTGTADSESKETEKKDASKDEQKPYRDPSLNIVRELFNLVIYIGIVILICFLLVTYVGRRVVVSGNSMNPTLQDQDSLWVDMLSYRFHDPKRFDVVIFPYEDSDTIYVKRIIGLPGEKIQMQENGIILINDQPMQDPYGNTAHINDVGLASNPIYLGPDEYFVLGDNRNDSHDSRYADVGNIHRSELIGKVTLRLSPIKKFGKVK